MISHLSHRQIIRVIDPNEHRDYQHITEAISEYDYIAIDLTEVPDLRERATNHEVLSVLKASSACREIYGSVEVVVFTCAPSNLPDAPS